MTKFEVRYQAAEPKDTSMFYECTAGPFESRDRAESGGQPSVVIDLDTSAQDAQDEAIRRG